MEITFKQEVETKANIELPYYLAGNCHAYKVISEKECIQITHSNYTQPSISMIPASIAFSSLSNDAPCTEAEFNELYNATLIKLQNAKNSN